MRRAAQRGRIGGIFRLAEPHRSGTEYNLFNKA
jgi:hypothetical protein